MIVRESLSRDIARLIVWYPVRLLIGILPIRLSFDLFRFFGNMHFYAARNASLRSNIRRGLPAADNRTLDNIVRIYLQNHYIDRLHIFTYPKLRQSRQSDKICGIEGTEHLDAALKKRKGAIIVLGHYGPIQLPLFQLGQAGYPLIQVGLPTDEGLSFVGRNVAFRLRLVYENMIPAQILPADTFLRPLFRHLKQNGIVMMNIDPAGGGKWIGRMEKHPFFGRQIPFPIGPALLAEKTDAPVLPLSIHRINSNRYLFQVHPPDTISAEKTPELFTRKLAKWYEKHVLTDPGLWHFWDEFEPGKLI
jgi:phosphatidylinositol dimannoside acyltransferase